MKEQFQYSSHPKKKMRVTKTIWVVSVYKPSYSEFVAIEAYTDKQQAERHCDDFKYECIVSEIELVL